MCCHCFITVIISLHAVNEVLSQSKIPVRHAVDRFLARSGCFCSVWRGLLTLRKWLHLWSLWPVQNKRFILGCTTKPGRVPMGSFGVVGWNWSITKVIQVWNDMKMNKSPLWNYTVLSAFWAVFKYWASEFLLSIYFILLFFWADRKWSGRERRRDQYGSSSRDLNSGLPVAQQHWMSTRCPRGYRCWLNLFVF